MNISIIGQFLLGFLAVVAILVNIQLVRLGLRYRKRRKALVPIAVALLFWLPLLDVVIAAGGIALAESSLLSYQGGQSANDLGWFVVGTGLSIFADTFAALIWIPIREVFNVSVATDDLLATFAMLASQVRARTTEEDER